MRQRNSIMAKEHRSLMLWAIFMAIESENVLYTWALSTGEHANLSRAKNVYVWFSIWISAFAETENDIHKVFKLQLTNSQQQCLKLCARTQHKNMKIDR